MAYSEAHKRAVAKYNAANYDRVELRLPKGQKEIIMDYAQSVHGESLNAYINRIINEDMKNHSPEQKAD